MTKRPIDWTDEELRKACAAVGAFGPWEPRKLLAAIGVVHPAEAREREREAWDDGWNAATCTASAGNASAIRDRSYPSLLPQSPPPLVLSTGTWAWKEPYWDHRGGLAQYRSPICRTASDAEKLAEWLREYGSEEEKR